MSKDFLERFKSAVLEGASTLAARGEEAAKTGKMRLDLMSARRALQEEYAVFGRMVYNCFQEGSLDSFKDSEECIKQLGSIQQTLQKVDDLASEVQTKAEAKNNTPSTD